MSSQLLDITFTLTACFDIEALLANGWQGDSVDLGNGETWVDPCVARKQLDNDVNMEIFSDDLGLSVCSIEFPSGGFHKDIANMQGLFVVLVNELQRFKK